MSIIPSLYYCNIPAPGHLPQGGGIDWSRVTATSILGLDRAGAVLEGQGEPELSGACIHLGVRRARPEARVIMVRYYGWIYSRSFYLLEKYSLGK